MKLLKPKSLDALPRLLQETDAAVSMTPEEPEDMWHAYNLIAVGDRLRASAIRCENGDRT